MLGPLSLRDATDREIEVGGTRLRMLLVRLALEAGRIVPNESLIEGLWGAQPPVDATNALQSLVSRLRKAGMAQLLESHPVGYSLALTDVDAHTFERLATEGSRLLRDGQATRAAEVLYEALELWRGPALVDVAEAPFAAPAVARLAELRLTALEDRIEADIRRGRETDVIVELYALVREHPLRERLACLLVRALHLAGRQADALAAYETARRTLADELGVDPGAGLREAHLAVLRATPSETPAAGSVLPAQLTSFVGRQQELTQLNKLLAADRLVTLVGPGGAGKTRLATEAATRAAASERVWFVHLAGLREAVDVPLALASALGLGDPRMSEARAMPAGSAGDVTQRLVNALADRADLIVLDNCEHLVTATAHLADALLAGCPRLRILATSREPLAITGETLLPVGALDLPDEGAAAGQAAERAAVRLFADRAASVRPGFVVDDQNVAAVVAICRQLDGLPLALELAAARLRSMTVGQVAERLDDRFRLLSGGSRTSLPRHQTLGAVVEWSWSLLADPERTLATRMSVFANAATLDAITAVCADDDLPAADVLYVLASLVEKSLVEALEGGDGQPRYRMLQTVRAFAAQRLADARAVEGKFTAYILATLEDIEPRLRGPEQIKWLATFDVERANVLAAVRIAVDHGDGNTSYRIAAAWTWYWMLHQGVFGDTMSEQVLPFDRMILLEADAPAEAVAMVQVLAFACGGVEPLQDRMGQLVQTCRRVAGRSRYPLLALVEAAACALQGNDSAASDAFRRALRTRDPWTRAAATLGGALAAENEGQLDVAERWLAIAARAFRRIGDRWGVMMCTNGLAGMRSIHGDIAGSIDLFTQAHGLEVELGPLPEPPMTLARLGEQHYRMGDHDEAVRIMERALVIGQEQGLSAVTIVVHCRISAVARAMGDLAKAREHLATARRMVEQRPETPGDPMRFWVDSAEIVQLAVDGDIEAARATGRRALAAMRRGTPPDFQSIGAAGQALAEVAAIAGDLTAAARLVGASAAVRGAMDLGSPEVHALLARFGEAENQVLAKTRALPVTQALELLGYPSARLR